MREIRLEAREPDSVAALPSAGTPRRRSTVLLDTADWALARGNVFLERGRAGAMGPVGPALRALAAGRPLDPVLAVTRVRRPLDPPPAAPDAAPAGTSVRMFAETLLAAPPGAPPEARLECLVVRAPSRDAVAAEVLAARLSRELGLVPSRLPWGLRALMLVYGEAPFLGRAAGEVSAADPLGLAARKVLAIHLRRVQLHDPGTRAGADPEELHDMRVGTRRLRAALRVFAPAISPARLERFSTGLRRLGRQLGAVRDLDVQLSRIPQGPEGLRLHLEERREAARGRLLRALDRRPYLDLVAELDRFVAGASAGETPPEALEPAGPHAAEAIGRAFRRLRRAGRAARSRPAAAALHEVRIRAKRLRYALEFFSAAAGEDAAALVERLTEIQDLLGAHQDAVVGARLARAWGRAGGGAEEVAARIAVERRAALECRESFGRAWDRFEEKPTRRRVKRVLRRLDPDRRDKKKGDAASGVP